MTALTGLVAWYKPETLAASYANGDPISTWADSSGNGRDLTGTTTTRPLALASAINGYMAADFDGTDDVLSSASYTHSGNIVVAMVFNLDAIKNYNAIASIHNSATPAYPPYYYCCFSYASGDFATVLDDGTVRYWTGDYTYGGTPTASSTNYIAVSSFSAIGSLLKTNGEHNRWKKASNGNPASPTGTAYIHLGATGISGGFLNGKLAEVIIWTPTSDHAEVPWVEGYLADKYAITLADGHLFKNAAPENAPTTYNATGGATLASDARIERLK